MVRQTRSSDSVMCLCLECYKLLTFPCRLTTIVVDTASTQTALKWFMREWNREERRNTVRSSSFTDICIYCCVLASVIKLWDKNDWQVFTCSSVPPDVTWCFVPALDTSHSLVSENSLHIRYTVWVKKNPPLGDLTFFYFFFTNSWEFVIDFLHAY